MRKGATSPSSESETGRWIRLELLGVACTLAGRSRLEVPAPAPLSVLELGQALCAAAPGLRGVVLGEDGSLLGGHAYSRDGVELVTEAQEVVTPGEEWMLLSAVGGG